MTVSPDTPDYQRGVVSAQVLLANVAGGVASETVGIPPNAETIVVTTIGDVYELACYITGVETGIQYAGVAAANQGAVGAGATWFFDVASTVDQEVTVSFASAPPYGWTVYADAGVHITADVSKRTSRNGLQYVIPTVPSTDTADHPPTEISFYANQFTSTSNVLGGLPADERYRIFAVNMTSVGSAGAIGVLYDSVSGVGFAAVGQAQCLALTLPGQGVPLSASAGVDITLSETVAMNVVIYYTVEQI